MMGKDRRERHMAGDNEHRFTRRAVASGAAGLAISTIAPRAVAQLKLDFGMIGDIGRMLKNINLDEQDEIELGDELFGVLIQTMGGVYRNSSAQASLKGIATRLFETSARPAFAWDAVIIDSNEVNAWALPGGKVAVNKGLLRYVDNEDELAAVIAHEMGHAELSHAAKEMKKKAFYSGLSSAAQAAAVAATDREQRIGAGAGMKSIALPMMRLVASGYARDLETEADSFIVSAFQKTGYNLLRGAGFYRTLLDIIPKKSKGTTSLFAGHPETEARLEALETAGASAPTPHEMFNPDFYTLKETFPTRTIYKRGQG